MGGHYGTIHVRTEDRDAVRSAVASLAREDARRFLIGPALGGWVTVYPENYGQSSAVSEALAAKLSGQTLIHCLVHDEDVFAYWLFAGGRKVDAYNSCPDYFREPNPPPRGGNAQTLRPLLIDSNKVNELQRLLDADPFDFELERQEQFAALLGLPNTASAYESLQAGETAGVRQWKQFIHVPDLALEKIARRAVAAKERAQFKRLQRDGILLVDAPAKRSGNQPFFKAPAWAIHPASSAVILGWQDYMDAQVAGTEWLRFRAPHWRGERWEGPAMDRMGELRISAGGAWLAIRSGHGSQIDIWEAREKRRVARKQFPGVITAMTFGADERWLFVIVHSHPHTQLHRVALRSGLEDAVLTDPLLHFQAMAPHPGGRLLAVVDNYGVLVVIEVEAMRIVHQAWIQESHPLLPEAVRASMLTDALEKMLGQLKDHLSPAQMEQYRQQSARHALPKEVIRVGLFSPEGEWLFCGTDSGVRGLRWKDVLRCQELKPVPVQLSADAESVIADQGGGAVVERKSVYGLAFDALRRRVLYSGLEGKVSFLELNGHRAGNLLVLPGRVPLLQLALTPDRSALVATGCRIDVSSDKESPPHFQIWNYPALCRAVGLEH